MSIVSAVCTQCGAKLDVDSSLESAICPYCETPFVIEMPGDDSKKEANNIAKAGDTFIKLNEYGKAESKFKTLSDKFPYDYRGWWGLVRVNSKDFTDTSVSKSEFDKITEFFDKAMAVAPTELKGELQYHFEIYSVNTRHALTMLKTNTIAKRKQLDSEYQYNRTALLNQIENSTGQLKKMEKTRLPSSKLTILLIVAYIAMFVLIAQIQFLFTELTLFFTLVAAGIAAYFIKRTIGGRADKVFKNKKHEISDRINQLKEQVKAEEVRYFNTMDALDKDLKKAGNI